MKKSRMKMALAVALMMALPQISLAQSALLGTLKNAASTALANSNNKKVSAVTSILTGVEKMKTVTDFLMITIPTLKNMEYGNILAATSPTRNMTLPM